MTPARHADKPRRRATSARPRPAAIGSSFALHGLLFAGAAVLLVAHAPAKPAPIVGTELRAAVETIDELPPAPVLDPAVPPRIDEELLPETADLQLPAPEFDPSNDAPTIQLHSTAGRFGDNARLWSRRAPQQVVADATPAREPVESVAAIMIAASRPPAAAIEPPRALAGNHPPLYPRRAEKRGWEGSVRLSIEVDASGTVADVRVVESSGFPVLDFAAREAALAWRYEPATRGGSPVAFTLHRTIRFRQ